MIVVRCAYVVDYRGFVWGDRLSVERLRMRRPRSLIRGRGRDGNHATARCGISAVVGVEEAGWGVVGARPADGWDGLGGGGPGGGWAGGVRSFAPSVLNGAGPGVLGSRAAHVRFGGGPDRAGAGAGAGCGGGAAGGD